MVGIGFIFLGACKKNSEPNKILPGIPVATNQVITAARAAQQHHLLTNWGLSSIVPIINRLGVNIAVFAELSGPDAQSRYTFSLTERHFGTANFTIQFRDTSDLIIDPFVVNASTGSLSSVLVTVSGSSSEFTYSQAYTIRLAVPGQNTSSKVATDTPGSPTTFTGSGYAIQYAFLSPGISVNNSGITGGRISATGTGPNSTSTSLDILYAINHSANGTLSWEGQSGTIHFLDNGNGFIITNNSRIIFD